MNYDSLKPLMQAVVEGYVAASEGKFPPYNPYAPCGLYAGEEDGNLPGGAWFFGYWTFFKNRKKGASGVEDRVCDKFDGQLR